MLIAFWLRYIDVISCLNKLICKLVFSYYVAWNVNSRFMKDLAIQNMFTCFYMVFSYDCMVIIVIIVIIIIRSSYNFPFRTPFEMDFSKWLYYYCSYCYYYYCYWYYYYYYYYYYYKTVSNFTKDTCGKRFNKKAAIY